MAKTKSDPNRKDYFDAADTLRALAILLVVLCHLSNFAQPTFHHRELRLSYVGIWGVNFFFMLSGALLAGPFLRTLLDPSIPRPSIREFYTRRFLRIYPLYLVSAFFSIIVMGLLLMVPMTPAIITTTLLMVQNFSPFTIVALNTTFWTMGVDAAFYVALPIFTLFLAKFVVKGPYARRVRAIVLSFAILVGICLVFRFCSYAVYPEIPSNFGLDVFYVRNILGLLTAFVLGCSLALMRVTGGVKNLRPFVYLAAICIGVAMAIVELLLRLEASPHGSVVSLLRFTIIDPMAALSCALIFFGLAEGSPSFALPLIRSPYVKTFATWAYAIYLFHYPIIDFVFQRMLNGKRGWLSMLELTVISGVLTLLVAVLAHRFIERPFLLMRDQHRDPAVAPAERRRRQGSETT